MSIGMDVRDLDFSPVPIYCQDNYEKKYLSPADSALINKGPMNVTIYTIILYFSLMFSLISIIRLIPFKRSNRNTLFIRFLLALLNIISVWKYAASIGIVPILIILITILFTEGSEIAGKYISGNFLKVIRSHSYLLKLNLIFTCNTNAFGFLEMARAVKAFDGNSISIGEEILFAYTEKVRYDLSWVCNCIVFLTSIDRSETAFLLLQRTSADLTKKNIPYQYLQVAIQLYCDNHDFEMARAFLEYMEEHYYDAQHKFTNIQAFLYYYALGGNEQLFEKILIDHGEILKYHFLPDLRKILMDSGRENKIIHGQQPKSYHFEMAEEGNRKIMPLYAFAGIICCITLLQLFFSRGDSLTERIFSGSLYAVDYIRFGASVKSLIFKGEWIRLLTPVFLHGGLLHLGLNIFGLINIARVLLRFFDKYVLLFIFSGGAAIGNILSLYFSPAFISVGASGGVFSILGALFLYLLWHKREINKTVFHRVIVNFAVILLIQILFGIQNSNIDNFAHLGGFLGGVLLTCITLLIRNTRFQNFYVKTVKMVLFLIAISLMFYWPPMISQNQFDKFPLNEHISESGLNYSIPSTWKKYSDRYIDSLSNGQIIFHAFQAMYRLEDYRAAVKEAYTEDGKFRVNSEFDLDEKWKVLELTSNNIEDTFNLYYFCSNEENQIIEVHLFLDPDLYGDYSILFKKILDSVGLDD